MHIIELIKIVGITCLLMLAFQYTVIAFGIGVPIALLGGKPFGKGTSIPSFIGNSFALYVIVGVLMQAFLTNTPTGYPVIYLAISSFLLYGLAAGGIVNKVLNGAYRAEVESFGTAWLLKFDALKVVLVVPFVIVAFLVPSIVLNVITKSVFQFVMWGISIPLVGILLGIVGLILALQMMYGAIVGVFAVWGVIIDAFNDTFRR